MDAYIILQFSDRKDKKNAYDGLIRNCGFDSRSTAQKTGEYRDTSLRYGKSPYSQYVD